MDKQEIIKASSDVSRDLAKSSGYGLLNGLAGMAIINYLLYRHTGMEIYKRTGADMLEEISDNIGSVESLYFEDGLTGIGWMAEWLVQNNLVDFFSTDEVLEDVDDTIYKTVIYAECKDVSLLNGLLGKLVYFIKRLSSRNNGARYFRQIAHKECLVILSDDLSDRLKRSGGVLNSDCLLNPSNDPAILQQLIDLGTILISITTIVKVNEPTIENALYECADFTEKILGRICMLGNEPEATHIEFYCNLLYLAVCYYIAGIKNGHSHWKLVSERCIDELQQMVEFSGDHSDFINFKLLTIYSLLHVTFPCKGYQVFVSAVINVLHGKHIPSKLHNGAGVVALGECKMNCVRS